MPKLVLSEKIIVAAIGDPERKREKNNVSSP